MDCSPSGFPLGNRLDGLIVRTMVQWIRGRAIQDAAKPQGNVGSRGILANGSEQMGDWTRKTCTDRCKGDTTEEFGIWEHGNMGTCEVKDETNDLNPPESPESHGASSTAVPIRAN